MKSSSNVFHAFSLLISSRSDAFKTSRRRDVAEEPGMPSVFFFGFTFPALLDPFLLLSYFYFIYFYNSSYRRDFFFPLPVDPPPPPSLSLRHFAKLFLQLFQFGLFISFFVCLTSRPPLLTWVTAIGGQLSCAFDLGYYMFNYDDIMDNGFWSYMTRSANPRLTKIWKDVVNLYWMPPSINRAYLTFTGILPVRNEWLSGKVNG